MQSTNIILLQSDPAVAQLLATSLSNSFHGIHVAGSFDELRVSVVKHRPSAIIVDLESATLADVEELKNEFQGVRIICNHRVADEEMWTRTLTAGADDCCPTSDTRGILSAASANQSRAAHSVAA